MAGLAVDGEPPPPKMPTEQIVRDAEEAYLAVCLGVKDQNEDLREWIEYHRSIGVGKFYIFDDNSTVPAAPGLQDLIQEGEGPAHLVRLCRALKVYSWSQLSLCRFWLGKWRGINLPSDMSHR